MNVDERKKWKQQPKCQTTLFTKHNTNNHLSKLSCIIEKSGQINTLKHFS